MKFEFAVLLGRLAVFLLMISSRCVNGFHDGAPDDVCSTMQPSHGTDTPQNSLPPYQITTSSTIYTSGQNISGSIVCITACGVATSCCISDVPSQWEGRNFDPSQLPHFSTDLNETLNQESYPGYDPTRKIWLTGTTERGSAKMANICLLLVLSLFCMLRLACRSYHRTDHDHLWRKTRVSA